MTLNAKANKTETEIEGLQEQTAKELTGTVKIEVKDLSEGGLSATF